MQYFSLVVIESKSATDVKKSSQPLKFGWSEMDQQSRYSFFSCFHQIKIYLIKFKELLRNSFYLCGFQINQLELKLSQTKN